VCTHRRWSPHNFPFPSPRVFASPWLLSRCLALASLCQASPRHAWHSDRQEAGVRVDLLCPMPARHVPGYTANRSLAPCASPGVLRSGDRAAVLVQQPGFVCTQISAAARDCVHGVCVKFCAFCANVSPMMCGHRTERVSFSLYMARPSHRPQLGSVLLLSFIVPVLAVTHVSCACINDYLVHKSTYVLWF
jgi:hypothetical protein